MRTPRARRHGGGRALLAGCVSPLALAAATASSSCTEGTSGGIGQAHFSYVCPTPGAAAADPDAWCATSTDSAAIPDVAIGAPFRLAVDVDSSGGPQPAVAGLAQSTAQGWSLPQEGWLGFVAWSGADVIDFTHVRAEPVASLAWQAPVPAAIGVSASPLVLAVVPRDGNGVTLGGAIACTFTASDPTVLGVTGTGRVASVVGVAAGDAFLTAACGGLDAQTSIHVTGDE
jgi:hypothetical protein